MNFSYGAAQESTASDLRTDLSAAPSQFQMPAVARPTDFVSDVFSRDDAPAPIDMAHGTTTLAFKYQGGVVVSVDSRSTMGSFIGSNSVKKVIEINAQLVGTMAGGAADCSFWERELGRRCRLFHLRNKELISVAAASKILSNITYSYKGQGLSMGTMVCGADKTGVHIYKVDSEGARDAGNLFCVGSGGTFAYSVMDAGYRWDLTDEEACELGRRAIHGATHRDAYSGGIIQVYLIKEGTADSPPGWTLISREDTNDLYYNKYAPMQGHMY